MLRTVSVVLLVAAVLATPVGLGSAMAAPVACAKQDAQTGVCLVEAASPGQAAGASPLVDGVSSGGVQETGGAASPQSPCTYTVAQPQPVPTSHLWQGQSSADGVFRPGFSGGSELTRRR